jgi:integrase
MGVHNAHHQQPLDVRGDLGERLPRKPHRESSSHISARDTRASYITNALDQNERMSFIQKQVGHTTTRMIVDHYYRHVPAPDDGDRLEGAWNSTTFLPPLKDADFQVSEKTG